MQGTLDGPRPGQYSTWDCIRNKSKQSNTKHKTYVPFIIYIGETGNRIRKRINGYKRDIRNNKNKPVAEHFDLPGHSVSHLQVSINTKTNRLELKTTRNRRTKAHMQIQLHSRRTKQGLRFFITLFEKE